MAESLKQKHVDILHWLQGIRPPSPEPLKESDRELTSSSDISTTEQASTLPPVTRPISTHSPSNLADNTVLLYSTTHPKPSPVSEPAACVSTQPSLFSAPPPYLVSKSQYESVSIQSRGEPSDLKFLPRKTRSPLPLATPEPKLPTFVTFDEDAYTSEEALDQRTVNMMVNRPPSRPLKSFSRASTSPILSDTSQSPPISRKMSSSVKIRLAHSLKVDSDLLKLHRKSLSQDDVSQLLVVRERRISKERRCSDSELTQNDPEEHIVTSERDSQSSTGACGLGSEPSGSSSTHGDTSPTHGEGVTDESPVTLRRRMYGRGVLSAGSVDVLATRLREKKMEMRAQSQDEEDVSLALPTHLLSPTSPTLSHHSHSPSPTPPVSPYHTPIVPLNVRSETSHPQPLRLTGETESGFSKRTLKQFNMSQQFSFDTTNDEDFRETPSRHPKFLKNNVSVFSKSRSVSHSRSHSDISSIPSLAHSSIRSTSIVQERQEWPATHSSENKDQNMRKYKSQFELSKVQSSPEGEGRKPLSQTLYEIRKQQTGGKTSGLSRQDSGLGTLSTISQRYFV